MAEPNHQTDETALKQKLIQELGPTQWDSSWASVARLSPEILTATINLHAVPRRKQVLSAKIQELIAISVYSASTLFYTPGIQKHIAAALAQGATRAEIVEVLELTGTLGIHACNIGVPLLVEVMKEEGIYDSHATAGKPFDEGREKLKEDFTRKRGYWHPFWEDFLKLDPEFFEAYLEYSSVPWVKDVKGGDGDGKGKGGAAGGALEPVVKELIYCAFDVAATHLYVPGLKLHMKNVIGYGGTPEMIMEVLEIATQLSTQTLHLAAPILEKELAVHHQHQHQHQSSAEK